MNKIYKVIWSKVKNCWVVASELAKSHTKSPKSSMFSRTLVASVLACLLNISFSVPAIAAITWGSTIVVNGLKADIYQLGFDSSNGRLYYAPVDNSHNSYITLPNYANITAATASKLGTVKIGSNITVSSGTISLTKANVVAALGYTPPTTDTNTTYSTGNASTAGITKLYTGTGTNTDGTMTQSAINSALGGKLSTGGGTITGKISAAGRAVSWYKGRDSAMLGTTSITGYNAVISSKTNNGSWDVGAYNSDSAKDKLIFTYIKDTDYNSNNNQTTAQIYFNPDGSISASGGVNGLTKSQVTTALGYTPPTTDTNTTYDNMSASELTIGTATTARSISAKTIADYVTDKVSVESTARGTAISSEATTRTNADTALSNRIGSLSADGNYIKKSDTNDVSANLVALDTAIKSVNTSSTTSITNLQSANTDLSNRIGTVSSDGSYIKKTETNDVSANLVALDNAVTERTANFGVNVADNTNDNFDGSGASGTNAIAIGHNAVASAEDGIAIGTGNQVTGTHSGAIGDPNIVNADSSYIVGNNSTVATGAENSFIFGNNSTASNAGSLIFGSNASSTGTNGVVVGNYAKVSATDAVAVGQNASASANGAVAIGKNSVSAEANTVSLGHKATDINPATGSAYGDAVTRKISNVTNGTVATDVATVGQTIELVAGDNITVASAGTNATGQQKYSISVSADNDFVQYDDADHETITLTGPTGTGTKITGLADGRLSASSTDAVTGAQLYETNQDVSGLSDDVTSLTATVGSIQTTVNTLGTNYTTMNSTLNTVKNNVDTGFNVTVEGALAKTVNPTSNYIDFKAGDGITVANDNGAVKISVSGDGVIASGDTGAVTGGVAYTELRPADGNYIAQANTTATNLTALDSQLKTTTDNLATEVTNRTNADTALGDRIGSVASDGNYIKASSAKNVAENLGLLDTQAKANADAIAQETTDRQTAITNEATARADADTALGNRIDALSGNAVHYDGDAKTKVTLEGSGGTTIDNVKDGTLSATSKEAVNGSQLYTTNTNLANEISARESADTTLQTNITNETTARQSADTTLQGNIDAEASARSAGDTALTNKIGSIAENGNYIGKDDTVFANLSALDTNLKATADALATETTNRTNADNTLQSNIEAETTAREQAIATLTANMGTLSGNAVQYDDAEKTKVTLGGGETGTTIDNVKDGTLSATSKEAVNGSQLYTTNQNLASEVSARQSADTTLQANITAEETARTTADTTLQGNIDAEASARSTADTTLQSNIDTEASARASADTALQNSINTLDGVAVKYDSAETKAKITLAGAEGTTIDNLKDATLSATSKEAVTGKQLFETNTALSAETTARENADSALQTNLGAEITTRTNADTAINTRIDNLTVDYEQAVTALGVRVDNEVTARQNADTELSDRIGAITEDKNYIKASVQKNVSENLEILDSALKTTNDTVASNKTAIERALADEVTARENADTALSDRITALSGNAVHYDGDTKVKITLEGTGGTTIDNVKDGVLSADSKEAVNGSQLYTTNQALAQEVTDRATAVSNEVTARADADTALSNRIGTIATDGSYIKSSTEKNVSENLGLLDTNLARVDAGLTQEIADRTQAVSDEATARQNADTELGNRITALSGNAVHYDGDAKTKITLEGTGGTTIDNVKAGTLSADSMEAVNGAQLHATNEALATEVTDRTNAINSEATARQNADTALQNSINVLDGIGVKYDNAETKAKITLQGAEGTTIDNVKDATLSANSKEAVTGSQLFTTNTNLANETSARESADTTLQTNITNESTAREQADTALGVRIDTEITDRQTAITNLTNSITQLGGNAVQYDGEEKTKVTLGGGETGTTIDNVKDGTLSADSKEAVNGSQLYTTNQNLATEISNRESAEATLQGNIDAEATARGTADTTLQTNITNEAIARADADTALGTRIDTEKSARESADTALSDRIGSIAENGNYITTTNTVYQNMSALDTGLKSANDAIAMMQTDTDTKLDTKVNVNATNIGTNASVNNSELWGMALGDGAIAPGNYKLLTGDTVYSEVRPSSDGTIVRSNNTVGANLLALDATIASLGGSLGNAVMYNSVELDTVTLGGNRGTTLANVKAGAVTRTSMEAINGSQLWSVEQDIDGFASDISKNTRSIRTLNSSVTNALSSVASVNELVNTINDVKADASLNNLTTDGRQVITNAAINAVQEYMASQNSGTTSSTNNTTNNTNSTNNVGILNMSAPQSVSVPRTLNISAPVAPTSVDVGNTGDAGVTGTVGTTGDTGTSGDVGTVGSAPTTGLRLMATNPASGTANYVVYDDANATKITLEGDVGTGTKITNLADGRLSASSTDAVTGAQLYETNQEISAMQDTIATANATSAQTQTAVTQLNNRVVAMESTVNTTKTQVETGFNVTVDGAKVKSVTPNSNSINLVAGDGVNITNDNGSVKFAINTNGTVAVGDTGLVSGGTVFNEVRVNADGNYIAKDNTTAQNLTALDTAVKTNTDAVSDLQTAVTSLATGAGITDDVVDVLTAKLGDGTVSADSTGLVSGKTLYDEVRVEEDGDVVKSDKTTAENLKALETALTGVRNGAPRYDNDEKTSITLGDGTTPVAMHNVADGNVAEGSHDAVTGNQLWQTNQAITNEATSRQEADTALSNRIGELQENGNTIQKDKNVSENLNLLDNAVKANADAVEAVRSDLSDVKGTIAGVQETVAGVQEEVAGVKSDIVDIQTASNIDADKWAEKLGTGKAEQGDKNLVNGDTLYNTIQDIHTEIENRSVHGVSINSVDENDTNYDSKGATGDNAMALGVSAGATGEDGIAIGHGSKADGKQSIAIGTGNQVTGDHSGAFGDPNNVSGTGSYAIGNDNTISGNNTFVIGNNVTNASGNNSIVLGAGSDGSHDNVVSIGAEGAERKIIHVADGDVSKNSKEAVNGGQLFKVQKDLQDAQGIDVDKWSAKLGTGEVAEGDSNLVTGGTVFNAIKGIDIINSDATTGEIRIGGTASYDGMDTINVAKADGTGRVITGVIANPDDASSAANVGYVDAIGQNIVDATNNALNRLNNKANKIGANAAAMASLEAPPMDGDEKWAFSAAVGHYEGETAGAVGAFYKPQDNVIVNVRGSFGNDENMIGAGVGIALQRGASTGITKAKLAKAVNNQAQVIEQLKAEQKAKDEKYEAQLQADRAEIAELKAVVAQLVADKKAGK